LLDRVTAAPPPRFRGEVLAERASGVSGSRIRSDDLRSSRKRFEPVQTAPAALQDGKEGYRQQKRAVSSLNVNQEKEIQRHAIG